MSWRKLQPHPWFPTCLCCLLVNPAGIKTLVWCVVFLFFVVLRFGLLLPNLAGCTEFVAANLVCYSPSRLPHLIWLAGLSTKFDAYNSGGYRDAQFNVSLQGSELIFEIQLHHKDIYNIKTKVVRIFVKSGFFLELTKISYSRWQHTTKMDCLDTTGCY